MVCLSIKSSFVSLTCSCSIFFLFVKADVIVADLNPTPSGIHDADHCLSVKNSLEAFDFCHRNLRYGGSFMLRFIRGRHDSQLFIEAEALFGHVSVVRTKISPSDVVHTADRDFTETWLMCRLKRDHRQ